MKGIVLFLILHIFTGTKVLADPGGLLGAGPSTPYMWEFFKAKEFMVSANQGRISAGAPPP